MRYKAKHKQARKRIKGGLKEYYKELRLEKAYQKRRKRKSKMSIKRRNIYNMPIDKLLASLFK